jgi:hypothetical protein
MILAKLACMGSCHYRDNDRFSYSDGYGQRVDPMQQGKGTANPISRRADQFTL